jgi:hypothetical protein
MADHVYETTVQVIACQYDGTGDSVQPALRCAPHMGQFIADAIEAGLLAPSNWLVIHPDNTWGFCPDEDFQRRYRKRSARFPDGEETR